MLASLDSRELQEWIAFDRIEPLPESWRQTGLLAALLSNGLFAGSRRLPGDFIPVTAVPEPQTAADANRIFGAIAAAMAEKKANQEL